ncbi:MAG: SDR family oxidoreductase [Candidatus Bathyarchaeia archaeon]
MKFSRILITGGAGFIGSHLVDRLMERGFSVVVLDDFNSGKMENVHNHLRRSGFRLVKGDIRNKKAVQTAIEEVDAVIHLAALIDVEKSLREPYETHDVNVNGTLVLLKEAVRCGVKRFLFASSAAVYGEGNPLPLIEDCMPKPLSPYAASKVSAEHYCEAFHKSYGLRTVVLRYFNIYGPRQGFNSYCGVITKFVGNALVDKPLVVFGDGSQTRDFIYIDDVVDATLLALEHENSSGHIFNVCTGKPTSINELAETIREIVGKDLEIIYDKPRKGDIRNNYGNSLKAEKMLGFKAKISLREGIRRTATNFA